MDGMSERPNLLVIDTLGFWAGLSDFNDYATVSKEFKPVLDFAQGNSIAVLIVHHSRKGNGQDIDAISGSNALAANAGAVALLSKVDGNDTQRKLTVWSRDVGEYELIVDYNPVTHFYDKPEPLWTRYRGNTARYWSSWRPTPMGSQWLASARPTSKSTAWSKGMAWEIGRCAPS